jgi:hypothetical protein
MFPPTPQAPSDDQRGDHQAYRLSKKPATTWGWAKLRLREATINWQTLGTNHLYSFINYPRLGAYLLIYIYSRPTKHLFLGCLDLTRTPIAAIPPQYYRWLCAEKRHVPPSAEAPNFARKIPLRWCLEKGNKGKGLPELHICSQMHFCTFNMLQNGWCKGCRTSLWLLEKSGFPLLFLLKSTVICSHGNLRKKVAAAAMHIWQSLLAELASQNKQVIATKCLHLY